MTVSFSHTSVLLQECLDGLAIKPDGIYIDATFGRGSHSGEILKQLDSDGRLIAFDRDPQAIEAAARRRDGVPAEPERRRHTACAIATRSS